MKTLPEKFTKLGWEFEQLSREGEIAVYLKSKDNHFSFETVRIRPHKAYELAGIQFEAGESYPSYEQWGTYGWTYPDFEAAAMKADVLIQQAKEKKLADGEEEKE